MKEQHLVYRVIVTDDEPDFSEWLRSLLDKSEDFEVVGQASDGAKAINLITSIKPDVVIADIFMPELDGLEVTRRIHHHSPDIKVILISAREERIYEKLAKEDGAFAFIPKSRLSLETLLQTLQEELQP